MNKSDCKDIAVSYRYSHSFVHKTCLFEAGASLSASEADKTIIHAIMPTYTIKIKEIMVVSVHCRHNTVPLFSCCSVAVPFIAG